MSGLLDDFRFGLRSLRKSPGFTVVALLTFAVGVGANTAIFSFVNTVLLKPLPYAEPDRIVRLDERQPDGRRRAISTLTYLDWRAQAQAFERIAARTSDSVTLTGRGEPVQLSGSRVSPGYFEVFGFTAALGRTFQPEEEEPGRDHVVVLGDTFWRAQFGADREIIGKEIRLNDEPNVVIGVLPPGRAFTSDLFRPLSFPPSTRARDLHWLQAFARLRPGVSLTQAQAQMDAIAAGIALQSPTTNKDWGVSILPFASLLVNQPLRQSLLLLFGAVGVVLFIACANLANLALVRGLSRSHDLTIRASLGASRWQLIRPLLAESTLLAFGGGICGAGLGYGGIWALRWAFPPYTLPAGATDELDWRVLVFTALITMGCAIACGLLPAVALTRPNLAQAARAAGPTTTSNPALSRWRDGLIVGEVALALVLLAGAAWMVRSFLALQDVPLGFDGRQVLTAQLPIAEKRFPDGARLTPYLRNVLAEVSTLPGVVEAAFTSALPMSGWGWGLPFQPADAPPVDPAKRETCFVKMVSPSYHRVMSIPIRSGRSLASTDTVGTPPVIVINEALARKCWPQQDPIGKRLLISELVMGTLKFGPEIAWEVVGVAANEKVYGLDSTEESPVVYATTEQCPQADQFLVVKTKNDPRALQESLRRAVHRVNADQPVIDVMTMEQIKADSVALRRLRTLLLGLFAWVALALCAIGLFGVVAHAVAERTREIGIRGALGATPRDNLWLVMKRGALLVGLGLAVGFLLITGLSRLIGALVYGTPAENPATLALSALSLALVATLACWLPARRAGRIDPIIALRES